MCYRKKKKPLPLDVTQVSSKAGHPPPNRNKSKDAPQLKKNSAPIPAASITSNNRNPPSTEADEKNNNVSKKIGRHNEDLKGPSPGAAKFHQPKTDATQMESEAAPATVPSAKVAIIKTKSKRDVSDASSEEDGTSDEETETSAHPKSLTLRTAMSPAPSKRVQQRQELDKDEPDFGDSHEDFDQIYRQHEESALGDVQQQHGNVLTHFLSQVSIGMDLTKVTLPTFILERRSLLEMYADFFAHPDDFLHCAETDDPENRMVAVVKYYLGTFYPARKSGVAKKPYNPILGETFRCRWTVPSMDAAHKRTTDGPFPGSDVNQVTFVAEQVSHHPPVSAFYAEHPGKRVSLTAHIYTKSSFTGLSIGVTNIGHATICLLDYDEKYIVTFPNGCGRSIMSTPWVELGGKVEVNCEKTGYHAEVEFLTKPFFGGKPHKIAGNIYKPGQKKPIMTLKGEWNGIIHAKPLHGKEFLFLDVKAKPEVSKECEPIAKQGDRESRRLWRHVTCALFRNQMNNATAAKQYIEQRQRDEAKKREQTGQEHQCKYFEKDGDEWRFKHPLETRKEP